MKVDKMSPKTAAIASFCFLVCSFNFAKAEGEAQPPQIRRGDALHYQGSDGGNFGAFGIVSDVLHNGTLVLESSLVDGQTDLVIIEGITASPRFLKFLLLERKLECTSFDPPSDGVLTAHCLLGVTGDEFMVKSVRLFIEKYYNGN